MRRLPLRSPPRMRGKVHPAHHAEQGDGITPAYAGKSRCNLPSTAPWKDHPRVCGEKASPMMKPAPPLGSPPRVRGKAKKRCRSCPLTRITPAYAGKSFGSFCFLSFRQDHPRVCGEKQAAVALPQPVLGSPPRMRGKVELVHQTEGKVGITPACAGKSSHQHGAGRWRRDHPRVCGEKGCCKFSSRNHSGSPPRMRGKDLSDNELQVLDGITPAYAGKSVRWCRRSSPARDHPRVCGEKVKVPLSLVF